MAGKLKLTKRGRIYYASGTIAGRRIRKSLGTGDRKRAEEIAAQLEARLWKSAVYGEEAVRTFEEAALSYLEAGGEGRFLPPLLRHFRGRPVASIKPGEIVQAAIHLYPNASAATRNRQVITPMRAVINHAASLGWCAPVRIRRFPEAPVQRTAVTREWIDRFIAAAMAEGTRRKPNPWLAALALFMFTTGARIGEALALTWADIDLHARRARIRMSKLGGEERTVALTTEMVVMLANLPRTPTVFRYASRHSVIKSWRSTCSRAGIEYVPPHQAGRHSFATALNRAGVDPRTAMEAGGWKSARLYLERYVHTDDNLDRIAAVFEPGTDASHSSAKGYNKPMFRNRK